MIPEFGFLLEDGATEEFLPKKGEPAATGWDVRAFIKTPLVVNAREYIKIPLGFRMAAPAGWWLKLCPRSSSFAKKSLHALYGVIDEQYENQMVFCAQYLPQGTQPLTIEPGEAIAQVIPVERQEMVVKQLSQAEFDKFCKDRAGIRGLGGFGSTS